MAMFPRGEEGGVLTKTKRWMTTPGEPGSRGDQVPRPRVGTRGSRGVSGREAPEVGRVLGPTRSGGGTTSSNRLYSGEMM
jgi:hypothetical protein